MKMTKVFSIVAGLVMLSTSAFAGDDYIYKSTNKVDFVKIAKASKSEKEGGLSHPYTFEPDQIRALLRSLHFSKKVLLMKDIENRQVFDEQNIEFLAPYITDAFKKAKDDQIVVVSYFTRDSKLLIQDDRLTVFSAFIKEDGLHLKFKKIYAKMIGDRTTMGADRAMQEAKGINVTLELQPGQNRISWKPEELVLELKPADVEEKTVEKDAKGKKNEKAVVKEKKSEKEKKEVSKQEKTSAEKSVRDRLKELDELKKDEMITDKEYQKKREELIKQL